MIFLGVFQGLFTPHDSALVRVKLTHAVGAWYNEIKNFDIENSTGLGGTFGHFSQVVWRSTSRLCMGWATYKNPAGMTRLVIVARYSAPGNMYNWPHNVQPLCGDECT